MLLATQQLLNFLSIAGFIIGLTDWFLGYGVLNVL